MFERKRYKSYAKKMLQGRWTIPVLVTLISTIILEIFAIPPLIQMLNTTEFQDCLSGNFNTLEEFYTLFATAATKTNSKFLEVIQIIVESILSVAALSVYLQLTRSPDKIHFKSFIEGFNNWWKATLGIIWEILWVWLWALLFIIPGFIKYYSYSQMFMIMNEFENVSVTKAMNISKIITKGHKWDLFVLDLSFIGWNILATFSLGIGNLWLTPYKQVSCMNAYHAILREALEKGLIKPEDLQ